MLRYKVKCKECGHEWITSSLDPTCSKCLKKSVEWLSVMKKPNNKRR